VVEGIQPVVADRATRSDAETWNDSLRNRGVAGDLGDRLGLRTQPTSMVSFMTSGGEGARP
jgi:hypothetical protein